MAHETVTTVKTEAVGLGSAEAAGWGTTVVGLGTTDAAGLRATEAAGLGTAEASAPTTKADELGTRHGPDDAGKGTTEGLPGTTGLADADSLSLQHTSPQVGLGFHFFGVRIAPGTRQTFSRGGRGGRAKPFAFWDGLPGPPGQPRLDPRELT